MPPVSLPRATPYHHGNLRAALIEAAVALVAEHGTQGFSLRGAARAVGVAPSAAYRHFPDKAALLNAVAQDGFARLAAATTRALETKHRFHANPAIAALHAVGAGYIEFAVGEPERFRVMFGPYGAGANPDVRSQWTDSSRPSPYGLFRAALAGLADAGVIAAEGALDTEIPAWSAVHGYAALLVDGLVKVDAAERAAGTRRVVSLVLRGLGAPPDLG
jgi:AcrR family transcriptional regulator